MKFFEKFKKISSHNNKNDDEPVLFVCVENAGRSQMAEGFFKKYAPKGFKVQSAGTKPVSQINPVAVEAMREIGIDISKQKSKEISEDMMRNSDPIHIWFLLDNFGIFDKLFI